MLLHPDRLKYSTMCCISFGSCYGRNLTFPDVVAKHSTAPLLDERIRVNLY